MSGLFIKRCVVYRKEAMHKDRWHRVRDYYTLQEAIDSVDLECKNALADGCELPMMRVVEVEITESALSILYGTYSYWPREFK